MLDFTIASLYDHALLIPGAVLAYVVHELGHALASYWMGDRGPEIRRRLTLNPSQHVSWMGLLLFLVLGLGWAKPLRMDPTAFKHPHRAVLLTALAGSAANLLVSAVLYTLSLLSLGITIGVMPPNALRGEVFHFYLGQGNPLPLSALVAVLTFHAAQAGLLLGLINLIPLPPFDGFWAVYAVWRGWRQRGKGAAAAGVPTVGIPQPGQAPAPAGAAALYHEGAMQQAGRKWPQAIESYQRALEVDPRHRGAAYGLGQCYERAGNRSEAARAYGRAYQLSADDEERGQVAARLGELRVQLADALAAQEHAPVAARAEARGPSRAARPEAAPSPLRLGWRAPLVALVVAVGAAVIYIGVLPMLALQNTGPEAFLARLGEAQSALNAGDQAGADEALAEALDQAGPTYAQPDLAGERAQAAVLVRVIAERAPSSTAANVLLAVTELDAGKPADALKRLRGLSDQQNYYVQFYTASAYLQAGQLEQAQDALQQAISLRADSAEAHSNLSFVLYQRAQYDSARTQADQAITLDTSLAHAWKNAAVAYLAPGSDVRPDLAYPYAFVATLYGPGLPSAHEAFSRALLLYGQPDLAEEERAAAEQLQSGQYSPYY